MSHDDLTGCLNTWQQTLESADTNRMMMELHALLGRRGDDSTDVDCLVSAALALFGLALEVHAAGCRLAVVRNQQGKAGGN